MAYLGKTPSQAVRSRYYFTATGGETSLSGADDNSNTLTFTDGNYVDVALNGVTLVAGTDYNTTTTNTIGGLTALVASDVVEVIVYDTFSVFGGNMAANLNFKDNVKANFGTGNDLQIYHDGSNSYVQDTGTGDIIIKGDNVRLQDSAGGNLLVADTNDAVQLYYGYNQKLATTATGVDVTGDITATHLKIGTTANPSAGGVRVVTNTAGGSFAQYSDSQTNSGFTLGTIAGSGIFYTHTGAVGSETYVERMRITSSGNVGIGTTSPSGVLAVTDGSNGLIVGQSTDNFHAANAHRFFTLAYAAERVRIDNDGLKFNGDTSTNNALDDYEEGSWTATFAASTTTATGYYTKVGATVFFTVYGYNLNVTSTGTSAAIGGLPFTNNGGYTAFSITHDTYTNNSDNGYINSGGTIMYPIQDGTVSIAGTVAGNPRYIMASGTYITDS